MEFGLNALTVSKRLMHCNPVATEQVARSGYRPPWFSVAPMMDWTDNHFRALARILSRSSWLYTEMIVAETIIHHEADLDRFLEFPASQHPIALQLGGSSIDNLAKATRLAMPFGYDEVNLNCGCPSSKVASHGCFGARLMLTPKLVGEATRAMASESSVPVTVKCRIGVDDADSYEQLCEFIDTVSSLSPTRHFIVHARKALLNGISPAKNRTVPPLKYEYVLALMRDFPHLQFTLNGGINTVEQVKNALRQGVHGVMVGRAAYNNPWSTLAKVDECVYSESVKQFTRREVLEQYKEYANSVIGKYGGNKPGIRHLTKPLLQLFHGEPGGCAWRRAMNDLLQEREVKTFDEVLEKALQALHNNVLDAPVASSLEGPDNLHIGELPPVWVDRSNIDNRLNKVNN